MRTSGSPAVGEAAPRASERPPTWPEDPIEVLRLLQPRLLAAARTLEHAGAEDLVQDTLVEVLIRHPAFRGIAHPLGYAKVTMFRIAHARRRRRWMEVPADLQSRLEDVREPDHADRVADRLRMGDALATLGRRQRTCLVLRYLEGLDNDAVAAVIGCNPSTVRSQIARGLERMRIALEAPDEEEEGQREP